MGGMQKCFITGQGTIKDKIEQLEHEYGSLIEKVPFTILNDPISDFNSLNTEGIYRFKTTGGVSNKPRSWGDNGGGLIIVFRYDGSYTQILYPNNTYGRFWVRKIGSTWYIFSGASD